jgi:adenine deaminase
VRAEPVGAADLAVPAPAGETPVIGVVPGRMLWLS